MMMKILKTMGLGILFFTIFLVLTFPYNRLAPKARKLLEANLSAIFSIQATCSVDDLESSIPLVYNVGKILCSDDISGQSVVDFSDVKLILIPKMQSLSANIGKGKMSFKINAGFKSPPTRVEAEFSDAPVDRVMLLLMGAANRANPQIPKYIKAEGKISGTLDWPLANLQKEKGKIDLQFPGLKFPQQSQLDLIGVKELDFSKATVKVNLASGKMNFSDVNFTAPQLAGKMDGQLELADDFKKSIGNITFKWKIEKSDAVLSSFFGPMIANNCPSPDNEGFCTKKVTRMSDLAL